MFKKYLIMFRNTDISCTDHLYDRQHASGSGDLLVRQTGSDVGKR